MVSLIILGFSLPAHAYLDPGSLSMFFQALVAGAVGGFFFFRSNIANLKNKFFGKKDKKIEKIEDSK